VRLYRTFLPRKACYPFGHLFKPIIVGLILAAGASIPAQAADIAGEWQGTYSCGSIRDNPFSLQITASSPESLDAEFHFNVPGKGETGSYKLRGRLDPQSGNFQLIPYRWVQRPLGFNAIGLVGKLRENGLSLEGKPSGCSGITLGNGFLATRPQEGASAAADAEAQAAETDKPEPASGGPMQGTWTGTVQCINKFVLDAQLVLLQDGNSIGGMLTTTVRNPPRDPSSNVPNKVVLFGRVEDGGAFELLKSIQVARGSYTSFRAFDGTADRGAGTLTGKAKGGSCRAVALRRVGALPPLPSVGGDFAGAWFGSESQTDVKLIFAPKVAANVGLLTAVYPNTTAQARQDRLAIGLEALFATRDGMLAFLPLGLRRQEGTFRPDHLPHHKFSEPFLVLLPSHPADEMTMSLVFNSMNLRPQQIALHRAAEGLATAMQSGKQPPAKLAQGLGGKLRAAPTIDDQCKVLADWAAPYTEGRDLDHVIIGRDAFREAMFLYEDKVFEPVFGVPYSATMPDQRKSVWQLLYFDCPRKFGMKQLSSFAIADPWKTRFDEVAALLLNRQEAAEWLERAYGEIVGLKDDPAGLPRLASIEADGKARFDSLTTPEREDFLKRVAESRLRMKTAEILARAKHVASLPNEEPTLASLKKLIADARALPVPDAAMREVMASVEAKGAAIVAPLIGEAAVEAQALSETLDGLEQATRLERKAEALLATAFLPAGSDIPRKAQGIAARRQALVASETVQAAFVEAIQRLPPGGDPGDETRNFALQYLEEDELAQAPYAVAIAKATDALEFRSIKVVDSSSGPVPGEPSAEDMARVVAQSFRNINESYEHSSDIWREGPMQQLSNLARQITGPLKMRLTYFEKTACVPAVFAGEAGYICDFAMTMDSNNALLAQAIPKVPAYGRGRFVPTSDGWIYRPVSR